MLMAQQPEPTTNPALPKQPDQPQPTHSSAEEAQLEEAHRAKACENLSPQGRKHFNLIEFDANEELVTEIRKHPIGLVAILFIGLFVTVVTLVVAIIAATTDLNSLLGATNINSLRSVIVGGAFFIVVIAIVGTLIGVFLYTSNVIFITSEKIAQVIYTSLFHRKISQLSIGDVQDVTVQQRGILAHLFHYGTLVVETSGEQQNYTFTFVPDPYKRSRDIVGAHERNLVKYGN